MTPPSAGYFQHRKRGEQGGKTEEEADTPSVIAPRKSATKPHVAGPATVRKRMALRLNTLVTLRLGSVS